MQTNADTTSETQPNRRRIDPDRIVDAVLRAVANSDDEVDELRRTFRDELEEFRQNLAEMT